VALEYKIQVFGGGNHIRHFFKIVPIIIRRIRRFILTLLFGLLLLHSYIVQQLNNWNNIPIIYNYLWHSHIFDIMEQQQTPIVSENISSKLPMNSFPKNAEAYQQKTEAIEKLNDALPPQDQFAAIPSPVLSRQPSDPSPVLPTLLAAAPAAQNGLVLKQKQLFHLQRSILKRFFQLCQNCRDINFNNQEKFEIVGEYIKCQIICCIACANGNIENSIQEQLNARNPWTGKWRPSSNGGSKGSSSGPRPTPYQRGVVHPEETIREPTRFEHQRVPSERFESQRDRGATFERQRDQSGSRFERQATPTPFEPRA
jgi:hypothetical protein